MLIKGAIYKNKDTNRLERVKYNFAPMPNGKLFVRTISPMSEATTGKEEIVESDYLEKVGQLEVGQFVDAKRDASMQVRVDAIHKGVTEKHSFNSNL